MAVSEGTGESPPTGASAAPGGGGRCVFDPQEQGTGHRKWATPGGSYTKGDFCAISLSSKFVYTQVFLSLSLMHSSGASLNDPSACCSSSQVPKAASSSVSGMVSKLGAKLHGACNPCETL